MRLSFKSAETKEFFRKERFEPEISRAFLITLSLILPLSISHWLEQPELGIIPAITAQLMSSANIKGTYGEKGLILITGTFILSLAAFLGTLAGAYIITAVVFIGMVAGLASLAKGIKDYGQIFGLGAVIVFVISIYSPNTISSALINSFLVFLGGSLVVIVNLIKWPLRPSEPFYNDISKPWYIGSSLMKSLTEPSFDKKKSDEYISQRENELRKALNDVLPWFKKKRKGTAPFRREALKTVRAASRFGATAVTLHSQLSQLSSDQIPLAILLKIKKTAETVGFAGDHITNAISSKDKKVFNTASFFVQKANTALNNLIKTIETEKTDTETWIKLLHIVSLFESAIHYLEEALGLILRIKNSKAGKSFKNTIDLGFRLQRMYKLILVQLQPNSLLLHHALRVMIMTSLGLLISYIFNIPRGYWIVLTIMVLLQPEFASTWERSRDRILGTFLGVILGSLLLIGSVAFHFSFLIIVIAICSVLYSYFLPKNYKVAVVFVTIMLVAILDTAEHHIDWHTAAFRLFSTVIGALLSVIAAYTLWPSWESLHFPLRMAKSVSENKNYLEQIGFELHSGTGFHSRLIAHRRKAEVENINLEDSLKQLKHEPLKLNKNFKRAQSLANLNKKLTRELTAFSSFLPEVRGNIDFQEAEDAINYSARILERIALAIQNKEEVEISSDFYANLNEIEAKIKMIKANGFNAKSNTLTLETSLLPHEIVYSELKRIINIIKEIVELLKDSEMFIEKQ